MDEACLIEGTGRPDNSSVKAAGAARVKRRA